jgi:hypothetical protein
LHRRKASKAGKGPFFIVTTYQSYDINGYTFYIIDQDKNNVY